MNTNKVDSYGLHIPVKVLTSVLKLKSQTSIRRASKLEPGDRIAQLLLDKGVTTKDITEDGLSERFVRAYLESVGKHPVKHWRNQYALPVLTEIDRLGFNVWIDQAIAAYEMPDDGLKTRVKALEIEIGDLNSQLSKALLDIELLKKLVIESSANSSNDKNDNSNSDSNAQNPREIEVYSDIRSNDHIYDHSNKPPKNQTLETSKAPEKTSHKSKKESALPVEKPTTKIDLSWLNPYLTEDRKILKTDLDTLLRETLDSDTEKLEFLCRVMGTQKIRLTGDRYVRSFTCGYGDISNDVAISDLPEIEAREFGDRYDPYIVVPLE